MWWTFGLYFFRVTSRTDKRHQQPTQLKSPYILSRIDWRDPRHDPIARQFLPLKSVMRPDHPKLTLDSLGEEADSPVKGLVHRYPDKVLFLGECVVWSSS
jgi:L-lysine 2,3-aminomutase